MPTKLSEPHLFTSLAWLAVGLPIRRSLSSEWLYHRIPVIHGAADAYLRASGVPVQSLFLPSRSAVNPHRGLCTWLQHLLMAMMRTPGVSCDGVTSSGIVYFINPPPSNMVCSSGSSPWSRMRLVPHGVDNRSSAVLWPTYILSRFAPLFVVQLPVVSSVAGACAPMALCNCLIMDLALERHQVRASFSYRTQRSRSTCILSCAASDKAC